MLTIRVHDILKDPILVSRESARLLHGPLTEALGDSASDLQRITVDFAGVQGVAPSFLDELLRVFESIIAQDKGDRKLQLAIANPPTRLSLKFEAIVRGHERRVQTLPDGSWLLTAA